MQDRYNFTIYGECVAKARPPVYTIRARIHTSKDERVRTVN